MNAPRLQTVVKTPTKTTVTFETDVLQQYSTGPLMKNHISSGSHFLVFFASEKPHFFISGTK